MIITFIKLSNPININIIAIPPPTTFIIILLCVKFSDASIFASIYPSFCIDFNFFFIYLLYSFLQSTVIQSVMLSFFKLFIRDLLIYTYGIPTSLSPENLITFSPSDINCTFAVTCLSFLLFFNVNFSFEKS